MFVVLGRSCKRHFFKALLSKCLLLDASLSHERSIGCIRKHPFFIPYMLGASQDYCDFQTHFGVGVAFLSFHPFTIILSHLSFVFRSVYRISMRPLDFGWGLKPTRSLSSFLYHPLLVLLVAELSHFRSLSSSIMRLKSET